VATAAENRVTDHQGERREWIYSHQPSAEHFQKCAEFLPLRNRGLGTLAVPVQRPAHEQQLQPEKKDGQCSPPAAPEIAPA
jgi:hypothetical protein